MDEIAKYISKANSLLHQMKYHEALIVFDKVISIDSSCVEVWIGRGKSLGNMDRLEEALEAFNKAISISNNPEAWVGKGAALTWLNLYEEALQAYKKAISIDSRYSTAWVGRGNVLVMVGRSEEALQAFNKAIDIDSESINALNGKGTALSQLMRYEEALLVYNMAIDIEGNSSHAWNGKGTALNGLERFTEALQALDTANSLDNDSPQIWYEKGEALGGLGRFDEALHAYDLSISIDSKPPYAWEGRGRALIALGRYEEALQDFEKVISIDTEFYAGWVGKGITLYLLKNYENALQVFDAVISVDSSNMNAWNGRGNVLVKMDLFEEALQAFDEAINIDSEYSYAWNGKGNALVYLSRYNEALDSYNKAISINDDCCDAAWNGKGNALFEMDRYEEALQAFNTAISIDGNNPYPWYGKGKLFKSQGLLYNATCSFRRTYYLNGKARQAFSVLDLISFFKDALNAPLFVYRLFNEHPMLLSYVSLRTLYSDVNAQCGFAIDMLSFIDSNACSLSAIDKLKLKGIISYYLGDPIRSASLFRDIVSIDDKDMMGQYYLLQSLKDYYEESEDILNIALIHATQILNNIINESVIQIYYAGHIHCFVGDYKKAIIAFKHIQEFLPANYMEMFCHYQMGNIEAANKLIEDKILYHEQTQHKKRGYSFLKQIHQHTVDLNTKNWNRPFNMYANANEINNAIEIVYEWLNNYEINYGNIPKSISFIDSIDDIMTASSFKAWEYYENTIMKMIDIRSNIIKERTDYMAGLLKTKYENVPFLDMPYDLIEMEGQLSKYFDNECANNDNDKYLLLIAYYFYTGKLSAQSAMLMSHYVSYKFATTKKVEVITRGMLEEVIKIALTGVLSGNVIYSFVNPMIPIVISSVGIGFFVLARNYLLEHSRCNIGDVINTTYSQFKSEFIEYVGSQMEMFGTQFNDEYPMHDYEAWVEDN